MAYNRSVFPESGYDIFKESYDLPPSLKPLAIEYQNLKSKATLTPIEVSRLNELMIILQDYIITPEKLNHFQDAVTATQKFFLNETVGFVNTKQTEMNSYVDTKKTEMQTEINKFNNKGTFNVSTQYYKNNFVDFNDGSSNQTYICLQDCMGKEPSSNPLFWRKLTIQGAKGDKGDAGANFIFKGAWKVDTTYLKDEAVQYGGVLFVSKTSGNIGNEPNFIDETSAWVKAMDLTVTVKKMIGTRNLITQTSNVSFIVGEISSFNPNIDSLDVFMNSTRITKGVDYTINVNNQSIDKISGTWNGSSQTPVFFEFVVTKNVINNLVFKDGSALQNGSVTRIKLDLETQRILASFNSLNRNILMTVVGNSEKVEFPSNGNIVTTTYDSNMQILKTSTVIFNVDGSILEIVQFSDGTYYTLSTTFCVDGSVNTVVQDN